VGGKAAAVMKEAYLYEKANGKAVKCKLCAHRCTIAPGKEGTCRVRENRGGTLYSLVYGRAVAGNVDPIEKKPFFHFLPGSSSFSIATVGCNFHCSYCQNFDISQMVRDENEIIGEGIRLRHSMSCEGERAQEQFRYQRLYDGRSLEVCASKSGCGQC
jgi:uncharacterized Fe-S radical SAM superfamily protein PflX